MSLIAGNFPPSKAVTLTLTSGYSQPAQYFGLTTVNMTASQIWWIKAEGSGSVMRIENPQAPGGGFEFMHVTETPLAIATAGEIFVAATATVTGQSQDWPSGAFYFNVAFFQGVQANGSASRVNLGTKMQNDTLDVSQTAAAIISAVNAALPSDAPVAFDVTLTGTVQGDAAPIAWTAGTQNFVTLLSANSTRGGILAATTAASIGTIVTLYNPAASPNVALVYPASGEQVAQGGVNIPIQIPAGESVTLVVMSDNNWEYTNFRTIRAITAAGNATGNAAQFILTNGQENIALASGFDGTTGIRPTVPTIAGTQFSATASGTGYGIIYPASGHSWGFGTDIPIFIGIGDTFSATFISGTTWITSGGIGVTQGAVASTTQTQAAATLITTPQVYMTTVANAGDAFKLSRNLRSVLVNNAGANPSQVFPELTGTINGGAANASISLVSGFIGFLQSNDGLNWRVVNGIWGKAAQEFIIGAFDTAKMAFGPLRTDQYQPHNLFIEVVEAAGTAGTPVEITGNIVTVGTSAANTDEVILTGYVDHVVLQSNVADGGNRFVALPPDTGTINGQAPNVGIPVHPGARVTLIATDSAEPHLTWTAVYDDPGIIPQTASTGSTQGTGVPLTGSVNCTVVGTDGDCYTVVRGVKEFTFTNSDSTQYADLFPMDGGDLGAGANNAVRVYPNSTMRFVSQNGLNFKMTGTRKGTSVFNGGGGLFTVDDINIAATSSVHVDLTSTAATTAVGYYTVITPTTGFTTTNFTAGGVVAADTRTTMWTVIY